MTPDVIVRQVPHPLYDQMGWREGMRVQAPSGDPLLIARFETGAQFAQHYIGVKLCQRPEITGNLPLQEETDRITKEIAPFARSMNAMFKASAGETTFRCTGTEGLYLCHHRPGWTPACRRPSKLVCLQIGRVYGDRCGPT